jgi:acetyltransferase-like isoleucine patch superfamily enzyme
MTMVYKVSIKKISLRNIKYGKNCTIILPSNLYDCELGNNVFVGPFVEITNGVKIGDRTRISSHSFVCNLVTIGKDCFIGHGVVFTNDLFRTSKIINDVKNFFKTIISDNVIIGSNATILPVQICSNVVIGAGSVVTKNINVSGTYAGNPARLLRKF